MLKINKIFLLTVLFFLTFGVKSHSEIVDKVIITGNDRISSETVIIFGDISIGKNYEPSDINILIKKLYETSFFSNISVELQNGQLNIFVVENPIINTIVFKGEKARKYTEAITELLTLREKTSYVKSYVKSDINKIREFYRSLGFYFVKIDADIEELQKNRVNIVYTLSKGDKAKISKINFLGEKKIREKKLRDVITSQESRFWKFLSKNVYLNKGRIELDKRLLKNYYKNKGYYEVDITSSNVEYSEGEGFVLTYIINAGKRFKFKKIYAVVDQALDQSAFTSLEKEFNDVVGKYYSQIKLTSILEEIDKLSEQKELQFVNHRIVETLDGDTVEIKIDIFEGEKFIVERINIVGNNVTNDEVIRAEMIVDEGDPYSALLINKSINKLKARNIFGKVEQKIQDGSAPGLKVLEVSVEEKATGEISAGAGVGTRGTSFLFAVSENNWLGKGMKLKTSINVSEEKLSGGFSIRDPNYKYSGNTVFTSFDLAQTDLKASSGYESSKTGFQLGTEFEQYENIYLSPTITATHEDIEVKDEASTKVKKMDGTFFNVDFGYGITWDRRNQPFQTTDGYWTHFKQRIPLIQDSSSFLNGFDASMYHSFSDDVVGTAKLYLRSIHGIDEDVRLTNRLFIPSSRLRGFNTKRVGPKDGEDYVGGNYTTALGFEVQLPNLLPESYRTDFSLFLDTANVWSVDYDSSLDDASKIRSAIGINANVFTVVGPLSFTLAQDLTKGTNDETQSFNFQLGTTF